MLNLAASHPSVKVSKLPQECWIGVHTGNHNWPEDANPLPSLIFRLWSALPVTGVLDLHTLWERVYTREEREKEKKKKKEMKKKKKKEKEKEKK